MLTAANCVAVLTDKRLMGLSGEPVRVAGPRLGCYTVTKLVKEAGLGFSCQSLSRACDHSVQLWLHRRPKARCISHETTVLQRTGHHLDAT